MATTGVGVLLVVVYTFFAVAAKDEIYYLCGNFKEGVSYTSVLRQLDTVTLSTYEVERSEQGKRVIHSSALHFNLLRCEIAFAQDERVSWASYR
jgi:hypothetical protein